MDMVVQYKPGSGNQVIILGGDPNYEIGKEIYAEALENVYEESPIYLILSLLRRLFCDQDLARLWFKGESTTQSDMYVLRSTFKEALMNQALMQYPEGTLSEREYATKLHQAMYDAKHRIKVGCHFFNALANSRFPYLAWKGNHESGRILLFVGHGWNASFSKWRSS